MFRRTCARRCRKSTDSTTRNGRCQMSCGHPPRASVSCSRS
jgi:hypothetical protein